MPRLLTALMCLLLAGATPGQAQQQATSGSRTSVLDVFSEFLVDLHAHMEACPATSASAQPPVADDWNEARAILVGSLWANTVPAEVVRRIEAIFEGPGAKAECNSKTMTYSARLVGANGWTPIVVRALNDLGFTAVEKPARPAQWEEIKSVMAAERLLQARLFDCLAVYDPLSITSAASSWTTMLVEAGQAMIAAGLPRDEVVAEIDAADIGRLWTYPEDGDQQARLLAECDSDPEWQDRFYQFRTMKIHTETRRILGVAP